MGRKASVKKVAPPAVKSIKAEDLTFAQRKKHVAKALVESTPALDERIGILEAMKAELLAAIALAVKIQS